MKRKWKIGSIVGLLTGVSLAVAPIASAHTSTLTASLDCSGTVSWNLASNGYGATFTITDGSQGVEGSGSLTAVNGYSVSGSYTIPTSVTSDTVTANVTWDDGYLYDRSPSVQITRPTDCAPPPPVCTYTKGFYRNHDAVTSAVIADMGGTVPVGASALTAAQAQAILDATPGQPGSVTFSSNLLLNLVQQLVTAELNVERGSTASTAVHSAISSANAAISVAVSGGQIQLTTSLSNGQANGLVSTLDSFNSSDDCS